MFLNRILYNTKITFLRYPGFKFILILIAFTSILSLLLAVDYYNALTINFSEIFGSTWLYFTFIYWADHPLVMIFALVIYLLVFVLGIFERIFYNSVHSPPPHPLEEQIDDKINVLNTILISLLLVLVFFGLPIINLCFPTWFYSLGLLVEFSTVLTAYWGLVVRPESKKSLKRLGKFNYKNTRSFDVASMGSMSVEIVKELEYYQNLRSSSPLNNRVSDYLKNGSDYYLWKGYNNFFVELSKLFSVAAENLFLFENTTASIRRALSLTVDKNTHIILTDMEYGSIYRTAKESVKDKLFHKLKVESELLNGNLDSIRLNSYFVEKISEILTEKDYKNEKIILLTSHVYYKSGFVTNLFDLHGRIKKTFFEKADNIIMIIDGAQAVGNIEVNESILKLVNFYATSGHKWLLSEPTIGILFNNNELNPRIGIKNNLIPGTTRPFTRYLENFESEYSQESIDLSPMISLNANLIEINEIGTQAIAKHNVNLVKLFSNHINRMSLITQINPKVECGLISIKIPNIAKQVKETLESKFNIIVQLIDEDILRFSFHYFHSERNVMDLIKHLRYSIKNRHITSRSSRPPSNADKTSNF